MLREKEREALGRKMVSFYEVGLKGEAMQDIVGKDVKEHTRSPLHSCSCLEDAGSIML